MNAFDRIIGYESIKNELLRICDMIQNREIYAKIGARLPHGLLLSGEPGLGKTMMCKAFIKQSGLPAITIRKNKSEDDFIASVTEAFEKAKEVTPCIVFLDDLDKFSNEDESHRDAGEYVAVQSGIDNVSDLEIFVLATVNDSSKLPQSLIRSGRFDRIIEVESPSESDAEKIIKFYLSEKKVSSSVNMEDFVKMIHYSSCSDLETILNEAALSAAYNRKDSIEMNDLVNAVLRMHYNFTEEKYSVSDEEEFRRIALHEAGHLVCCEVLIPGSVGFASICPTDKVRGGFVRMCKDVRRRPHDIIISLASKAAVELYYSDHVASGCSSDIFNAFNKLRDGISENATMGFGMVNVSFPFSHDSESFKSRQEAVTQALLEKYMIQAKDILIKNRAFLELATDELLKNGILLYSDIKRIKSQVEIISA